MSISKANQKALDKLSQRLGIDADSALNLSLNRGLFELGHISEEQFWLTDEHYRRPSNSAKTER